jgi:hypothetical protein
MIKLTSKILFVLSILALVAIFFLGSCTISRKQAERKVGRLLEMYPDIIKTGIKTDTVYKVDTFRVYIPTQVSPDSIRNLLDQYCQALKDSVLIADTILTPVQEEKLNLPGRIRKKITDQCTPAGVIGVGERLLTSGKDTIIVGFRGLKEGFELMIVNHKREINRTETKTLPAVYPTKWELLKDYWPLLLVIFLLGAFVSLMVILTLKGLS